MAKVKEITEPVKYKITLDKDEAEIVTTVLNYASAHNIKTRVGDSSQLSDADLSKVYDIFRVLYDQGIRSTRVV